MMTYEIVEEMIENLDDATYDAIASENIAREDAQWAGDTATASEHENRLVALLAEQGLTLEQYEHYLGRDEEEDWSDPDWDE
jgi:hypothetical protein